MTVVLNQRNMIVVNSLRHAALKASTEFNSARFFSDGEYAKASLSRLSMSRIPELAALAKGARESLFASSAVAPIDTSKAASVAPAPSLPQRYVAAKELMNGMAVDAAGLRSALFVLTLERTSVAADLEALLPRFHKLIARGVGDAAASILVSQVRSAI
jgi:hypothetical protein